MNLARNTLTAWLLLLPGAANTAWLAEYHGLPAIVYLPPIVLACWAGWAWVVRVGGDG